MSQVPQGNGDDILLSIANSSAQSTPAPSEVTQTPAATESTTVEPVANVSNEPTNAKSEGTTTDPVEPKSVQGVVETVVDDWDSEPASANTSEPTKTYDFSTIGKSLGVEIKSEAELVTEFKKLKEQNETLTKSSTDVKEIFANDVLLKANEIAKNNGDYLGFLGIAAIDFDAISARDLVEDDLMALYPDTEENNQKIQDYLDGMNETELEMRGQQIRATRKQEQNFEKNRLIQETEARKAQAVQEKQLMDKKVSDELSNIKDVNGFALKPHHKKAIYEDITSGKMYDKLFFTDGKFDPQKAIKTLFIAEQNEKMIQYYKTRSKTEGKKEVISSITNAELDRPGSVASQGEQRSAMDMYLDSLKSGK